MFFWGYILITIIVIMHFIIFNYYFFYQVKELNKNLKIKENTKQTKITNYLFISFFSIFMVSTTSLIFLEIFIITLEISESNTENRKLIIDDIPQIINYKNTEDYKNNSDYQKYLNIINNERIKLETKINKNKNKKDIEKIIDIIELIGKIKYIPDKINYNKDDYYASVEEFFKNGGGDCEDIARVNYYFAEKYGFKDMYLINLNSNGIGHCVLKININGKSYIIDRNNIIEMNRYFNLEKKYFLYSMSKEFYDSKEKNIKNNDFFDIKKFYLLERYKMFLKSNIKERIKNFTFLKLYKNLN